LKIDMATATIVEDKSTIVEDKSTKAKESK
jgi:hypothetical protein